MMFKTGPLRNEDEGCGPGWLGGGMAPKLRDYRKVLSFYFFGGPNRFSAQPASQAMPMVPTIK
jgi:hypothetical protein